MINVDEVTASRLIFAPMGVFLGKCCGNATPKIGRARPPNAPMTSRRAQIFKPSGGGRSAPGSLQSGNLKTAKALGLTVRRDEYDR